MPEIPDDAHPAAERIIREIEDDMRTIKRTLAHARARVVSSPVWMPAHQERLREVLDEVDRKIDALRVAHRTSLK